VKSTPDLPMAELYERIHNHYHDCRAPAEVLALVAGMSSFIDIHTAETWPEEFQEFTAQEALLYFYVLSSLEIPEFPLLWDVAGAVESRKEVFNNLKKFTHFSDSGAKKFINNFEQIPSLILCNYLKRIALPDADPKGWCISVKETGATSKESGYGTEETSRNER
ncbi:MAG: hypothetical protein OEX07_15210, partial [Gammaproteobacteria bacterium]|nr:hypothetical protein [Gammaproteobacteria bacterium]